MKRMLLASAAILLLSACAQSDREAAPSVEQKNAVVTAEPKTAAGAGATASSGMGSASAHGASVNESSNALANPQQHPPAR